MNIRTIYLPRRLGSVYFVEGDKDTLIKEAQQRLAEHSLYQAAAHGVLDALTRQALADFQRSQQLPATGILDAITFCRLQQAAAITEVEPIQKTTRASSTLTRAHITITKSQRQLTLFSNNSPVRQYPVAIGKPSTPTPEGNYAIATKILNPGGILGTRWMGLNFDTYGIHGTNSPWLIGQMVSNGCIRMHNHNAEDLFDLITVGTTVFIRN